MREAIGGISIFQIVIFFILLFTGVMCLTINHSKAFGVKDEIITIIENEPLGSNNNTSSFGLSESTNQKIVEHLNKAGYRITGKCPDGYDGYNRNGELTSRDAAYCIRANRVEDKFVADAKEKCSNNKCTVTSGDFPDMVYYDVVVFFQLDIPFIREIFNFNLTGSTKTLFG